MITNFPGFSHKMQFAAFSQVMGYLWEKPMHFPCNEVPQNRNMMKKRNQ